MSQYDNTNSGALFKNDKQNDRQPDYRGSWTDANGTEYWLSAWIKQSKSGQTFMSLSATAKEPSQAPAAAPAPAPAAMEFDNDIPF